MCYIRKITGPRILNNIKIKKALIIAKNIGFGFPLSKDTIASCILATLTSFRFILGASWSFITQITMEFHSEKCFDTFWLRLDRVVIFWPKSVQTKFNLCTLHIPGRMDILYTVFKNNFLLKMCTPLYTIGYKTGALRFD